MEPDFLNHLEAIPWFSNLGKPISPPSNVKQISSWDQWPGPEDESGLEIALRHQSLYDAIFSREKDSLSVGEEMWKKIHDIVIRVASQKVPFDVNKDAWHAPNSAVWEAAWTAGLVGVLLFLGQEIPADIEEQWNWFQAGHWPYGLEEDRAGSKRLLVY
jgi:hypothetical protein